MHFAPPDLIVAAIAAERRREADLARLAGQAPRRRLRTRLGEGLVSAGRTLDRAGRRLVGPAPCPRPSNL